MKRIWILWAVLWMAAAAGGAAESVLLVADEIPAMEILARHLKQAGYEARVVTQAGMPARLDGHAAVGVYIHRQLSEPVEKALIEYTRGGGRLLVLHHSISSGKRKNRWWFEFLGVELPAGPVDQGGYQWTEGVEMRIVNLAPGHCVTSRGIEYPERIPWPADDPAPAPATPRDAFHLEDTEVYLNHRHTGPRTVLFGLEYRDAKSGQVYRQATAGWCRPAGAGWIYYFMPGHAAAEFEGGVYPRLLVNALSCPPGAGAGQPGSGPPAADSKP